jgi:hypothetical protein
VIHDVVDAGDEEAIDRRADVGERGTEVLAEPGGRFGGDQPPPRHVSG